jgi:hypothetical protein
MQILFYFLYGCFGLMGVYFVTTSLMGRFSLAGLPELPSKILLLAGAVMGAWILYQAYLVGEKQRRWVAGAALVILAVVCCQGLQVLGAVLYRLLKGRSNL